MVRNPPRSRHSSTASGIPDGVLRVIAAAVLGSRGLLLVSKRAAPDVFYLPGGKPEPGEAPLECLRRELDEELGVGIAAAEPFAEVRGAGRARGRRDADDRLPAPASPAFRRRRGEIAALRWWPDDRGLGLAPAVRDRVIPRLRRLGRL